MRAIPWINLTDSLRYLINYLMNFPHSLILPLIYYRKTATAYPKNKIN